MRLDHLLSKETSAKTKVLTVTSYGQYKVFRVFTLFNLEGTGKNVPKQVRIPKIWGVSSAGRAPALQAGGHRFDPGTLHQKKRIWANSSAG